MKIITAYYKKIFNLLLIFFFGLPIGLVPSKIVLLADLGNARGRSIDNPKTAARFIVYLLLNFPLPIFIFASEASCCLGLGGGCCRATVAEETVNDDLWPYIRNNGNWKFHTSAI